MTERRPHTDKQFADVGRLVNAIVRAKIRRLYFLGFALPRGQHSPDGRQIGRTRAYRPLTQERTNQFEKVISLGLE